MSATRALILAGTLISIAGAAESQARYLAPRWSPDGGRLLIIANLDNGRRYDLYSIGADGDGREKIREDVRDGSWSPDGSRILFASGSDGDLDIYVMDGKGGNVRQLTNTPEMDYLPVWSPDGRRIAFVSIPAGSGARHDVHVMNADGTGRRAIAETPTEELVVSWAADGRRVAFGSNREGNWEIYLMGADGSEVRRLTQDPAADAAPVFSPDGKHILFTSDRGGSRRMWRMRADGTEPTPLGAHAGSSMSWSPDGRRIAFVGQVDGSPGVFVMNADGTAPRRVTPIPPPPPAVVNRLAPLAWLAGCWELRSPQRVTLEMWMPPDANLMLGASRTVSGGEVREFEQLRLAWQGDSLVYTAIPSGQKETAFRGGAPSDSGFTVANPAHDFPQVIIYRRRGADSLVARIEGPGQGGNTRGIDFPMKRVGCTGP
jgi:Tol biopolymer transport system component